MYFVDMTTMSVFYSDNDKTYTSISRSIHAKLAENSIGNNGDEKLLFNDSIQAVKYLKRIAAEYIESSSITEEQLMLAFPYLSQEQEKYYWMSQVVRKM